MCMYFSSCICLPNDIDNVIGLSETRRDVLVYHRRLFANHYGITACNFLWGFNICVWYL